MKVDPEFSAEAVTPNQVSELVKSWATGWIKGWDCFWFRSEDPATLGLIRLFTGCIVFYAHLVWSAELMTFFSDGGVLPTDHRYLLFGRSEFAWSHFDWFHSTTAIWFVHIAGLFIMALFAAGLWTRATSILTAMLVISYANRATGAQFGLDQIMAFLCIYLAIGNSGGAFSVDQWLVARKRNRPSEAGQGRAITDVRSGTSTRIAIRLIQLHMCLVYLFAGLGKLQGETWWDGLAIWYSLASFEYQTVDMTWLANYMWLVNLLTLLTVVWEVGYPALVWPRLTRPFVILFAIPIHLGIGLCMGMMTFGLIMLVGNLAFVSPALVRLIFGRKQLANVKSGRAS